MTTSIPLLYMSLSNIIQMTRAVWKHLWMYSIDSFSPPAHEGSTDIQDPHKTSGSTITHHHITTTTTTTIIIFIIIIIIVIVATVIFLLFIICAVVAEGYIHIVNTHVTSFSVVCMTLYFIPHVFIRFLQLKPFVISSYLHHSFFSPVTRKL